MRDERVAAAAEKFAPLRWNGLGLGSAARTMAAVQLRERSVMATAKLGACEPDLAVLAELAVKSELCFRRGAQLCSGCGLRASLKLRPAARAHDIG